MPNRVSVTNRKRGYYGLVMYHPKTEYNWGSLVRTANLMNARFIATIGARFPQQSSDTLKTDKHIPVFHFDTFEDFQRSMPEKCPIVAIELDERARDLKNFVHPERAVYMLGAEDYGIPKNVLDQCQHIVKLKGDYSMNVAVAGSIVLYHREGL